MLESVPSSFSFSFIMLWELSITNEFDMRRSPPLPPPPNSAARSMFWTDDFRRVMLARGAGTGAGASSASCVMTTLARGASDFFGSSSSRGGAYRGIALVTLDRRAGAADVSRGAAAFVLN